MGTDRITEYVEVIQERLQEALQLQRNVLNDVAAAWADAIRQDRLLFAFGSGHSRFIAGELYWRAGGLAPVVYMTDPTDGLAERIEGYAGTFLEHYDVRAGDLILVISNSGINPVPVEVAAFGKKQQATVVAVTSLSHSRPAVSRHSSGKKLFELADLVIDTGVPAGDAAIDLGEQGLQAAPMSTVISTALLNAVVAQTAQNLLDAGIEPPVLLSANLVEGDAHNRALSERYWHRLTSFPRRGIL